MHSPHYHMIHLVMRVCCSVTFFNALGSNVKFNSTTPSAHAWPTDGYGATCGHGVIENCAYDGPGAALQVFLILVGASQQQ